MSHRGASLGAFVLVGAVVASVLAVGDVAAAPRGVRPGGPATPPAHASSALTVAALDRRIADLDAEEQSAKRELDTVGPEVATAQGRQRAHGRALYRLTRAGMLPVGGGFSALVSHAMRVERSRRVVVADISEERRLRERSTELTRLIERVGRDRVALGAQRTAMDAARLALEDETRRQQAFDRAFESSTGPSDYVAVYGGGGALDPSGPAGFRSSRGRLLFPVAGRAEVRHARREGTGGPGLEIRATVGTVVRAVFAGRVAFSDRYGPYGRIVILDHGDHYYTVSGNLGQVDLRVGDEVTAGQRVGTVGDEGQGSMLYFEVRHGSETMPPGPWLGL